MGENLLILPLEQVPRSELGSQSEKCDKNRVMGEANAAETARHLTAAS